MIYKTRGIVFRLTKYGETSIIVNIFTDLFGLQGYIVNGVRSKLAKNKIALFQPLTLLDLVVYHRENSSINRIKEVKCLYPYQTIHADLYKSSIALFLHEMLNKIVKEQSHPEEIASFIIQSFIELDRAKEVENFHLIFLIKLSRYLGFTLQTPLQVNGVFLKNEQQENQIELLLQADLDNPISLSLSTRRVALEWLLKFFAVHVENMGQIRSVEVLKSVLS